MHVVKRNGVREAVSFDKVLQRIRGSARGLAVNADVLAQQVLARIVDGIKTAELDELAAQMAASLCTAHPDWGTLAARIAVSNHHKSTPAKFSDVVKALSTQVMPKTGETVSYLGETVVAAVEQHAAALDAYLKHDRDYLFDYFGFKTLEKAYLLKGTDGRVLERPQHMWMRVAVGIWASAGEEGVELDMDRVLVTYDMLSQKRMTHATPTLFNAGTPRPQLSSCYLIAMHDDSIAGIYKTLGDCAAISKYAGGIGLHVHNIRARGALIRGTNGASNGLVPMIRVFNNTARYVDQCFTPDTIIFTAAGPKPIEDVSITDRVLTSTGSYEAVRLPIRHEYAGKMLEIQLKNAVYPVRVTPEHQVFALQGQAKGLNFDVIRNRLEKHIRAPEFVDAKDLIEGDFLVFPVPTYEQDIASITEQDCRFYGIMLGDGHISTNVAGICLNITTKAATAEFVIDYLEMRGVTVNKYEEDNTLRIKWSNTSPGFKFTRSQLYDGNKQKRIDTAFLHLPISKVKQLLRGIIETDGCVGTKEIAIELSSYPLIEGIRYILLRLGALASGYERNRVGATSKGGEIHTNLPTAVIRVPRIKDILDMFPAAPKGEFFSFLRHDNNLYSRIQSISEVNYDGIVHDFEIEEPHDYVVSHLGLVHNGGGRRNGSFAIYLEPWHADIDDFLKLKLNTGAEEERARDLFYAMWIPDLFMRRVEEDAEWSLFCPSEAPGLADVHGAAFDELYLRYEAAGRARRAVSARKLWFQILDTQMETGTPYLLYKDAANAKSNQQNLGTIKSSNLCVAPETKLMTDKGEFPIYRLENQEVRVWNGDKWSTTTVRKTGEQQKLITVVVENTYKGDKPAEGKEVCAITCTPYHKFILKGGGYANRVDASELTIGTELKEWKFGNDAVTTSSKVVAIVDTGRTDDTYCFNEPENHAGVFNGILTGNCTEILEYSDANETAVCNLASLALPAFVDTAAGTYDYAALQRTVRAAVRNLNRVIDVNFYPTPETHRSNMRHRPIGLGVQGLADVFAALRLTWEDAAAADLNQRIFEHIYYAAVDESAGLAEEVGSYESFAGSPASEGRLQPDLWPGVTPLTAADGSLDWDALRAKARRGLRNSLLVAPMPTASTSQILGYNECFEPFTSNLYTRRTLAGEFIVVNKHLTKELMELGIWSEALKQEIVARNGSVQGITAIPEDVQRRYKTSWEIPQKVLIDMAAARGAFICQSQSLNLFIADPNYAKLTSMHFYAWKKGLKTGCYYLRTKAPVAAQKFTVDPRLLAAVEGGPTAVAEEGEYESDDSSLSSDEEEAKPAAAASGETRAEKLERLAREYEAEVQAARAAAVAEEGCLYCSA
jgi:ribonucleotide reductase alpha subunit